MTIDWWTLGLQCVNFLVLVWILARFLFRPVARMLDARQAAAHAALDEAQAARDEAAAAREAARAERDAVAAERAARIARAQEEAEAARARLLDEARHKARETRDAALTDLDRQQARRRRALEDEAAELATDIAARLLARLPDEARITGFIEGLARAVAALPAATRDDLGGAGPVTLRVARALEPGEETRIRARLAEVLGHAPELRVVTDEALLAGLSLETPHAIVSNSFRADLDRIRAGLSAEERER